MLQIFQSVKRLISICLVTLLLVTGTFFSFPAPARANADFVIVKCESGSNCSNLASFSAGVAAGSAVTLMATGQGEVLAAVGAGVTTMANTAAATAVAPAVAAAAPVIVPATAVGAVGYGVYRVWENHQNRQVKASK